MVIRAAEDAGARVLFHKVVPRRPAGMLTVGRPGFTHFIAVSRAMRCPDVLPIPDVIAEAGEQKWVRAMGACARRVTRGGLRAMSWGRHWGGRR